ncbi:MAG: hypothetical protein RBG13Loki_2757 [Promethearchaeota archaeon CR_4]|nr:MAG: hypothetical protein RBG13Loki_2757 [Candidatus Lokiarchaeota archaeon CR_4]
MTRKVMVAPVGFEMDRVLEAQKIESCNIWYILRNPPVGADQVGQVSLHFADKVVAAVNAMPLLESHIIEVRQSDLLGLVKAFALAVREQVALDHEVTFVFNTSGSTKLAQFAASFVAGFCRVSVKLLYLQPATEVVLATLIIQDPAQLRKVHANYLTHGECQPPFTPLYFPVVPSAPLTPAEVAILRELAIVKEKTTVSQLVPMVTGSATTPSRKDIVKTGWSVKALERQHLVSVRKVSTTKAVSITPEGELVAAALELFGKTPPPSQHH